jgi:hypothetical protein
MSDIPKLPSTLPPPLPPPLPPIEPDGKLAYLKPKNNQWSALSEDSFRTFHRVAEINQPDRESIRLSHVALQDMLSAALQLPNISFFAGSGTSLAEVRGPSMWDLWERSMIDDLISNDLTPEAERVCEKVKYTEKNSPNIEHFLSQCDAYLLFNPDDAEVETLLIKVKTLILDECTSFLNQADSDLSSYRTLLQKLARRRVRDPRLKVFTTNYDMCFETSASDLGMMVVDGFSYTRKRRFDGKYFNYDIVRRESEKHEFVEGIFQLYKLHGSVSWIREENEIYEYSQPSAHNACLIYPAKGKYQQAFLQPHLELLSRFLEALRQPNSCLIMAGFGFNDDHLSEPVFSAIKSNPSLKLIIADFKCATHIMNNGTKGSSPYWAKLSELAKQGYDIHFINGSFKSLVEQIPNLRALSPAEQLANAVKRAGGQQNVFQP